MLVVGLDQGFSDRRASSGFLLAEVDEQGTLKPVDGPCNLPADIAVERLHRALARHHVNAVAIDAPLGVTPPNEYRDIERVFSRGDFQRICKAGSSASPIGVRLASAGSATMRAVRTQARYAKFSQLGLSMKLTPMVEAFPTAALAVLVNPASLPKPNRGRKTDEYFECVLPAKRHRLGGVRIDRDLGPDLVRNHDQRMAVVCALVAAWYARGTFTGIGNDDGYFVMAGRRFWDAAWRREFQVQQNHVQSVSCIPHCPRALTREA